MSGIFGGIRKVFFPQQRIEIVFQVTKSGANVQDLGALAAKLTNHYGELADDTRGAVICTTSPEVAGRLRMAVIQLGGAVCDLVKCAGSVQGSPHDPFCQRDLADAARGVSEKVIFSSA
jgi:talin